MTKDNAGLVELLPCPTPWCKSKPRLCRPGLLHFVRCDICKVETPRCNLQSEAITAWNTRTHPVDTAANADDGLAAWITYAEARLHAWRNNNPYKIPKELRCIRVLLAALRTTRETTDES